MKNCRSFTSLRRQFLACAVALLLAPFVSHIQAAPSFSINDVAVAERPIGNTANASFTVLLSSATAHTTTVTFNTVAVTATAGSDFVTKNQVLTFPAGTTSQTVDVVVNGDAGAEANETFQATLSNATGGATIAKATGVGTIHDVGNNDNFAAAFVIATNSATDAGNLSVATSETGEPDPGVAEGKSIWWRWTAQVTGTVTVDTFGSSVDTVLTVYTGASVDQLTFVNRNEDFPTFGGYSIRQSKVEFTAVAGTTYSFSVDAFTGSPLNGGNVQFNLSSGGPLGSNFSINDVTVTEGAAGTTVNATFNVQLSPAAGIATTVDFDTVSDTATAGADFVPQNRVLTFPAGSTSQSVTVVVKGDAVPEANETFHVLLSHASSGAGFTKDSGVVTITNDDGPGAPAAFAPGKREFHGLIGTTSFDGADVGVLDVTLTEGSFKAGGLFNARKLKFEGDLDANGSYAGVVEVKDLGDVTITLSFDPTGATDFATGTLTFGTIVTQIRLDASSFSKANPAPQAGAYTFAIPYDRFAAPLAPRAHGSGTVKVSETGAILVAGTLGDGTPFKSKALVNASGIAHCFALLYGKTGSVSLALDFTPTAAADFTGEVRWAHPLEATLLEEQAFTAVIGALGSRWEKPDGVRVLPGFNATAGAGSGLLTDGDLDNLSQSPVRPQGINLGTDNKIVVTASAEELNLKINLSNGLVTGSFTHTPADPIFGEKKRTAKIKGAALRKSSEFYGLFPGFGQYGALFVEPGP